VSCAVNMRTLPLVVALALMASPLAAQSSAQLEELKRLSIEELAETDITSVSRRSERLADTPAAISVITSEDLRRLGVMTVPHALRLAGHLHVSQVSGPQYAISARGFAISTANKLLVLLDGRTVYSPVFAGTFWEVQDVVIADIERIEVTRGPGGAVWGANAVNGVINIITKRAADTRGTFVNAAAGTSVLGPWAIRHGGRFGAAGSYRAYAKVRFEDSHQLESGVDAKDDFDFGQAGFRIESEQTPAGFAVLQGDAYTGTTGLIDDRESNLSGGNLLARWTRGSGTATQTTVQAYYDHTYRRIPGQYRGTLDTFDLDTQHTRHHGRHTLVAGGGYRLYRGDDHNEGPGFFFDPRERVSHRLNFFGQDEIALSRGFFVTLGSKFEHNEFTGFEVQPTIRARWSGSRRSVWAAVSRAVRVPTRFDTDLRIRFPNSDRLLLTGSDTFASETVIAYEAGYRKLYGDRLSIDLATYVNRYDDLRSQELPSSAGQPVVLANMLNGLTRGVELSTSVQVAPWWQAHGSYAYHWKELTFDPGSRDATRGASEANDPTHLFTLRSYMNGGPFEVDMFLRMVGSLPQPAVDAYSELEARWGWRVRPGWDLSLIGTNLLSPRHLEFRAGTAPELYERAVSVRSTWRF
jgi:iron complex outermembrane receptor protein